MSGVSDVLRNRRMVRAYSDEPVPPDLVDQILDLARRAPSAGNTQPWAFVVLEGNQTRQLWDVTLPAERRASFRWPGLVTAPVVVVPLVRADAYVERYQEDDKVGTGLGGGTEAWPVPYWWVDGGMAVNQLLVAAANEGLGALFFGLFDNEAAVLASLGVPEGWRALGAVSLGWPAPDQPGRSATRRRPGLGEVVHRGRW